MSGEVNVCDVDEGLKAKINKLRLTKDKFTKAIIMKVNSQELKVVLDEELEDTTIEDIVEELPSAQPRYVLISYTYKHDDGRVSYPLCFVFISPQGCKPELNMMYAGTKLHLVKETGLTKVFELRSVEEFTEEWLREKLRFFR